MILSAFSGRDIPCCHASFDGGSLSICMPWPLKSEREVLRKQLSNWNENMEMNFVKDTLHIRGEFQFCAQEENI